MYEINLVPDVKAELLNKQKLRNLVILICIIVAIACGVVIVVLLGFTGTQALILNELDVEAVCRTTGPNRDVSKCDSKYGTAILKYENFEELLTIQDQMHNITLLNNEKIKMSRLFPILDIILPTGENTVKISELSADLNEGALYFDAQGYASNNIGYRSLEAFKKNAASSYFDYGDYMRKDNDTDSYVAIPSFCITETTIDGLIYGVYHKGNPGCEAPMISGTDETEENTDEESLDEEEPEKQKVEDIYILRTYKNSEEMTKVQNGNYKSKSGDNLNRKSGYYFASKCIVYGTNGEIDSDATLETCKLVPEDVQVGDSSYGKDSDENLVLSFSAIVTLNMDVFKASNKHMRIVGPSRQNVTDSYVQVRDMFTEKATELED